MEKRNLEQTSNEKLFVVSGAPVKVDSWTQRKAGHVYTEADIALMEGRSIGKNVRETILKTGLDYLIEEARNGEGVGTRLHDSLGRVYDTDFKYTWHMDYQIKAMDALKEGGLF